MKAASPTVLEIAGDVVKTAVPALLAIGGAMPIFGAVAGVAGKFYVSFQEAGMNMVAFKELKGSVDYGVQQLVLGSKMVAGLNLGPDHIIMVSLKKLATAIYEAGDHIKKFNRKYASTIMSRGGNVELDEREINDCQNRISRAIDDFRMDVSACAAAITLRNEKVNNLRELLMPPGFDTVMDAHLERVKSKTAFEWILEPIRKWIRETRSLAPAAQGAPLLMVVGERGVGKSALSTKLVKELAAGPFPVICFFCRKNDKQRNSAAVLIRSIAYECARIFPELTEHIIDAAQRTKRDNDIQELLRELILEPFEEKGVKPPHRQLTVVLDCIENIGETEEEQNEFADLLWRRLHSIPTYVQFVISSASSVDRFNKLKKTAATQVISMTRSDPNHLRELYEFIASVMPSVVANPAEVRPAIDYLHGAADGSFAVATTVFDTLHNDDKDQHSLLDVKKTSDIVAGTAALPSFLQGSATLSAAVSASINTTHDGLSLVSTSLADVKHSIAGVFGGGGGAAAGQTSFGSDAQSVRLGAPTGQAGAPPYGLTTSHSGVLPVVYGSPTAGAGSYNGVVIGAGQAPAGPYGSGAPSAANPSSYAAAIYAATPGLQGADNNPYGAPPMGYGAQNNNPYGAPPGSYGMPQDNNPYGAPPMGYGAQNNNPYGAPTGGYGMPQDNNPYGAPPMGYGAQNNNPYGAPQAGYPSAAPPAGFAMPMGFGDMSVAPSPYVVQVGFAAPGSGMFVTSGSGSYPGAPQQQVTYGSNASIYF
jgi:hypothetical protein